ncbi:MAG: histidine phosphatase family protein [Enhygromyxa sp.]
MSTLYVVRHAQASMFAANYDALSELGREQARRLGLQWAERLQAAGRPGFDAVFCGPAQRHLDTAALVGAGFASAGLSFPKQQIIPGFDEHDGQGMVLAILARVGRGETELLGGRAELLGFAATALDTSADRRERSRAWQLLYEAIMRRWLSGELELDGVETWPQFHARVREAFAELRERGRGEVAVFTSVGPSAVVLLEVLGLAPLRAFEQAWRLYNTGITRVVYSGARMTLDGFNEVAHLPLREWTHR